eukprot:746230-Hanusia_phi.AAC.1
MVNVVPKLLLVLVSLVACGMPVISATVEGNLPSQQAVFSSKQKPLSIYHQPAANTAALMGQLSPVLRLTGGKKGTASQGKRGTGAKSHPGYKYHMSYPRKSKHSSQKMKRYTLQKNPEGQGRRRHMKKMFARFKNGFRSGAPFTGRIKKVNES